MEHGHEINSARARKSGSGAPKCYFERFLRRGSKQGTIPAITGYPWEQMTLFEVICRLSFDARIRLF